MYALVETRAMALELETLYFGTGGEVVYGLFFAAVAFGVFFVGFFVGATWSYYRGVRTLEKALDFLPVSDGRYAVYTSRTGYAFHVSDQCAGLRKAGQLQLKKACEYCLTDLQVSRPTALSRGGVENCVLL